MEYLAHKEWCNGALVFAGDSYLAAAQWYVRYRCLDPLGFCDVNSARADSAARFIAAERPPHLTAIAPWEGIVDYYRELLGRGGIPIDAFVDYRGSGYCGKSRSFRSAMNLMAEIPVIVQARTDKKIRVQ